jgi:RNA polymerase sigma-B factor
VNRSTRPALSSSKPTENSSTESSLEKSKAPKTGTKNSASNKALKQEPGSGKKNTGGSVAARKSQSVTSSALPAELEAALPELALTEDSETVVDARLDEIAVGETTDETTDNEIKDVPEEAVGSSVSVSAYREFETTFARWKKSGDPALRDQLILMYRNLVVSLARRFLERGEMFDDIVQQGTIGLIYALDHFDTERGVRFTTFATPAILGEIRRYFRDKSWGIRVPRRMQELHQIINRTMEQLTQQYDRAPTYAEIANALNVPEEDVIEVVEMGYAVDPMSLDEHAPSETGLMQSTLGDTIGELDANLQKWHDWAPLQAALESLPERQQQVMRGIYFEGRSQVEIARALNVSQMYVSRAQRRALAKLKEILREGDM